MDIETLNRTLDEMNQSINDLLSDSDQLLQEINNIDSVMGIVQSSTNNSNSSDENNDEHNNDDNPADDTDVMLIPQNIPVVDLLDATQDYNYEEEIQNHNATTDDDEIIFVGQTLNEAPITIDLCNVTDDGFVGPTTRSNRRRHAQPDDDDVEPFFVPPPPRRRANNEREVRDHDNYSDVVVQFSLNPQIVVQPQRTLPPPPPPTPAQSNLNETLNSTLPSPPLKCAICLENPLRRQPTSTICGHVYCKSCIESCIRQTKKCALCKKHLSLKNIHRLFI